MLSEGTIGVFDSGYGGLTILEHFQALLPRYDYIYLGDNARTPYGNRSFDVVYEFTRESVGRLFELGCNLVILACNTASAKALRTIQQRDLPQWGAEKRVLGIIRPTAEAIGPLTRNGHVGLLATEGTIQSESYPLEIRKLYPDLHVSGQACPMWVPLVENGEADSPGADFFVKQYLDRLLQQDPDIDTVVLACTHYPLLAHKIRKYLPKHIQILSQGPLTASSLQHYLERHPELDRHLTQGGTTRFYTTENVERFTQSASIFLKKSIKTEHITL